MKRYPVTSSTALVALRKALRVGREAMWSTIWGGNEWEHQAGCPYRV